ncbi:MAG: hypothetical protein M3N57_12965 [Actinomycetota bacterium]|nr:hypothetical protein [Actinomycetota bacterium]
MNPILSTPRFGTTASVALFALAIVPIAAGIAIDPAEGAEWAPGVISAAVVGAVLTIRRPANPIGRIYAVIGALGGIEIFAFEYAEATSTPGAVAVWLAWFGGVAIFVNIGLTALAVFLFPDGSAPSSRWRWVGRTIGMAIVVGVFVVGLTPGPLEPVPAINNPLGATALGDVLAVGSAVHLVLLLLALGGAVAAVVHRFRRSAGVERQQVKWLMYAAAILGLAIAAAFVWDPAEVPATGHLINVAWSAIPVAVAVAVLRYRLYDIDRIVNRTAVYAVVTAMLAAFYVGLVVLLQRLLSPVTEGSDLAVAASTLAVAAAFGPLRRRVQGFVDRRFNRRRYDATRVVEAFAHRLRDEVDLDNLRGDLVETVRRTVQPRGAAVWMAARAVRR